MDRAAEVHGGGLRRDPVAWLLFALSWFSLGWFGSWEFNPNTATRMFAAIALAETGNARIDRFATMTIDKATFDGHAYTDKAPGMTLLAVPLVKAANAVSGETSAAFTPSWYDPPFNRFLKIRVRLTAVLVCALLGALATVLLYDLTATVTRRTGAGVFAALAFAFGTTIWGWSTTLFGHAPVASLFVVALWATERGMRRDAVSLRHAALAGLALGWAVLIEHAALLTGSPLGLYALWRLRGSTDPRVPAALGVAAVAAATALVALVAYNIVAFGTAFRVGYSGVTDFQGMQEGFFGLTYPKPYVLWQVVFGERRGILWVAPVLIAAPFGLAALWHLPRTRALAMVASACAVLPFLLNAAYFYWDGGHSTGPRHAVPAMGFLALGVGVQWAATHGVTRRVLLALLLAGSCVLNLMIASAEITAPDGFQRAVYEGVYLGRFKPGYLRTVADEWLGYTPWQGLAIWAAVAAVLGIALAVAVARRRDAYAVSPTP